MLRSGGPSLEPEHDLVGEVVGGRYRVEERIGRGGMAHVYRAVDDKVGEAVALKMLVVRDQRGPTLRAMFENEYHTLLQLAHPAIVRVRDFGTEGEDVFYTMELLQGGDLRRSATALPLEVEQACVLLRDVASALALIHSRRLVHRDVSPHNVWRLPSGRARLIDFGTLVAMGPQTRVVGTPPYVPPEAMHGQPLDGRTDLYALGALGYYLLTGKNAYPAKALTQLATTWKRPATRIDVLRPELPRPLCDLIGALLSLDRRGRPPSAAEVVDRLDAIVPAPSEDARPVAQSYLTTPTLVGRREVTAQLRRMLMRADRGRGAAISLVAPDGMGRSRVLESLLVEAKLMGARTVSVDLDTITPGRAKVATTLAAGLHEVSARPPPLRREDDTPARPTEAGDEDTAHGLTLRLGTDLVSAVQLVAESGLVVVAVDDVHRSDDSSLAVLARLAAVAPGCGFVLATTCDVEALKADGTMLRRLVDASVSLPLPPLKLDDTRALLASVFGEPDGLDEAATWLHELSQGAPEACLSYAQYLVDRGLARYHAGRWAIEARLGEQALPDDFDAMLTMRLRSLGDDARALALGLALTFDDTRPVAQPETYVRIQDLPKLLGGDSARTFTALGELLRSGVVEQRDDRFVLRQRALVEIAKREAGEEDCAHMHGRLGRLFAEGDYGDHIMTCRHFQEAGEDRRAADLLSQRVERMLRGYRWDQMRIAMTRRVCERALRWWRDEGGSPRDGIVLRRQFLAVVTVYEWTLGSYGDDQVARLRYDCGLDLWDRTDASAPTSERIGACLRHAQARHEAASEQERGFGPLEAVRQLAVDILMLSATYANALDLPRLHALAPSSEAIRPLSPVTELLADLSALTRRRVTGRELGEDLRDLIERFRSTESVPEMLRTQVGFVLMHIQGVEDALRGRADVFAQADKLELLSPFEHWGIVHLRWLGHCFAGADARAEALRGKVEGAAEDDVWRRKAFLFAELQLRALTGELLALKAAVEAIDELAECFSGWRPWAHLGHAHVHHARGELDAAAEHLERGLSLAPAGAHRAWVALAPAHAELRLARGDVEGARDEARTLARAVEQHGLDRTARVAALRIESMAECALGDAARAAGLLEAATAEADAVGIAGLPRFPLYETAAQLALLVRDPQGYARALGAIQRLLLEADAPALHRRHDALRERGGILLDDGPARRPPRRHRSGAVSPWRELTTRLTSLASSRERGEHVLHLLLEETGATGGHLFLVDDEGLLVAASVAEGYPSAALVRAVQERVERGDRRAATTAGPLATPTSDDSVLLDLGADGSFVAVPLHAGDMDRALGMATLVQPRGESLGAIRPALLSAIGQGLALALEEPQATRLS